MKMKSWYTATVKIKHPSKKVGDAVIVKPRESTVRGRITRLNDLGGKALVTDAKGGIHEVCQGDIELVGNRHAVTFSLSQLDGYLVHTTDFPIPPITVHGEQMEEGTFYLTNDPSTPAETADWTKSPTSPPSTSSACSFLFAFATPILLVHPLDGIGYTTVKCPRRRLGSPRIDANRKSVG